MHAGKAISFRDPYEDVLRSRVEASGPRPTVMTLRGDYDAGNADELGDDLVRAIAIDKADLVLHLGAVTFMDASTITEFIKAKSVLAEHQREFSLCALSTSAARIIDICGLECLVDGVAEATPSR